MITILDQITGKRKMRLANEGPGLGTVIPSKREYPLIPFGQKPFMICEVKRRSPSKGMICGELDAVTQAGIYKSAGAKSISVLTEEDHFGGSLSDLINVKKSFPEISVLRKDFLLNEKDIETAYLCGADAVLLIAGILDASTLCDLHVKANSLGMSVLVEVHDKNEIDKVRPVKPTFLGFNCRDLKTFSLDLLGPVSLIHEIDWDCQKVFESGLFRREDSAFARWAGFDGILVGEALVRDPSAASSLLAGLAEKPGKNFWEKISRRSKPWVKICGLTNEEDANVAYNAGADILGFVFAPSVRKAEYSLLEKLKNIPVLKVGVVVESADGMLPKEVLGLLEKGLLDAVQMHGHATPENVFQGFPFFKAFRPRNEKDLVNLSKYRSPRVLIDAFSETAAGGTGEMIDANIIAEAAQKGPLWLAGGLTPENIRSILKKYRPELVDVSSGVERSKGMKDHQKIREFIREVKNG